jgi:Uma2 family endonuclease
MSTAGKLIAYEDSLTMPENKLEEIVHGVSRIRPASSKKHVYLIEKLADILKGQLDRREYAVLIAGAGLGVERVPLTYRIPDLMVFRTEALLEDSARTGATDPYIWAAPDLIVECLSPSNRKGSVRELLADYERIAVPEVWTLDRKSPQFVSYRCESGALREWQAADSGVVTPLMLGNVSVDPAELWTAFE